MKSFFKIQIVFLLLSLSVSCKQKDTKNTKQEASNEFALISGNYTGFWDSVSTDRAFTDLPISASINEVAPGKFEGGFFISNNFTSCCNSGDNDGAISFTINNNTLNNFKYDDVIPNCKGLFTGKGILIEDNSIIINITGTDCDGDHKGTITLSKN